MEKLYVTKCCKAPWRNWQNGNGTVTRICDECNKPFAPFVDPQSLAGLVKKPSKRLTDEERDLELMATKLERFSEGILVLQDNGGYTAINIDRPKFKKLIRSYLNKEASRVEDDIKWRLTKLNWIKILDGAIKNRPTSWNDDPVREWRNASDEIWGSIMRAMRWDIVSDLRKRLRHKDKK